MADLSYPHSSSSLSLSSVIFTPENHINPSLTCDFDSEMEPKVEPLGCDYHEEDDDQVSFVTNLFHRSSEYDPTSEGIGGSSGVDLELGLGLGLYSEGSVAPPSQSTEETRRFAGQRVVRVDSDSGSDSDDGLLCDFDEIDGLGGVSDFDPPPFSCDYLGFSNQREDNRVNDELLGVDFSSQIHEREIELPGIATHNDDDGSDFFFGRCPDEYDDDDDLQLPTEDTEISFLFETYEGEIEDQERMNQFDADALELEWQIMLAVNVLNQQVNDMERMNDWRGSPPASDSVIENLPTVCLSAEGLEESDIVCAICMDDFLGEEKVRQLPCSHYYHGDCILPWLKMRNTCPVCRHELPTDDPEYEYRKRSEFPGWI